MFFQRSQKGFRTLEQTGIPKLQQYIQVLAENHKKEGNLLLIHEVEKIVREAGAWVKGLTTRGHLSAVDMRSREHVVKSVALKLESFKNVSIYLIGKEVC